jgi:tetratricopeptide (TPR) repeat protein
MCFDLGMIAESLNDDARALQALQQVADLLENSAALADEGISSVEEIDSQACDVYERMAKICLRSKMFDQAVASFGKAQKKAGEKQAGRSNYINYSLAQVLAAKEDYAGALKPLDEYLRSGPSDLEPYKLKIELLTKLKRRPEIAPFLEACCQADKNNASLKLLLAEEYGKENRTDEARKVYEKMAEDMPRDGRARPEVYRGLFRIWKSEGSKGFEKILDAFNASFPKEEEPSLQAQAMLGALREDGEVVGALLPLSIARMRQRDGLKPQTRFFLAVLAGRTKQLDNAEKLYRSCLDDLLRGLPGNEPEVYRGLLRVLWEQHKYEGVLEVCRIGLDKSKVTNRVVFQVDLARASVLLGKNKEAVAAANDAVDTARQEDRVFCRRIRAEILAQAGHYEPAVADCLAMLKEATKASETHEIRLTLSNVYTLAKEMDKAEDQLERALKDDPDDATACNDLGYIWADRNKNLAEAERLIRKALELDRKQKDNGTLVSVDADQDNAAYVDSLGWVLFRRGKLKEARAELERATTLEHGADDPVVWDHLGDVYMRSREPAKAKESWKKAVALYETAHRRPKDDRYKEIQQKLKLADQQTLGH